MRSVCGLSLTTACKIIAGLCFLIGIAIFFIGSIIIGESLTNAELNALMSITQGLKSSNLSQEQDDMVQELDANLAAVATKEDVESGVLCIICGIIVIVEAFILYKGVEQRKDGFLMATFVLIGSDIFAWAGLTIWEMIQGQYGSVVTYLVFLVAPSILIWWIVWCAYLEIKEEKKNGGSQPYSY